MKNVKKLSALFLSIFMIISLAIPCLAKYENTYKNTGDNAKDIIGVALTQIGYTEGANDDTKYGKWYGLNNNAWCAMFVSWCANQADIPKSIMPSHASCDVGMNWFKNHGCFENSKYYKGSYTPSPGDIVYFGIPEDSTHVGIVYKVNDNVMTTIEGNSSAKVQTVNYKLDSAYILGYGTPNYKRVANNTYTVGDYTTTAELLNIRAQPSTDSRVIAQVEFATRLTVTDFYGAWGKTTVDGETGWVYMSYCQKCKNQIKFDASGGKNAPQEIYKTQNIGVILPAETPEKDGYTFLGWSSKKDSTFPEYLPDDAFVSDTVTTLYAIWQPIKNNVKVISDEFASYTVTENNGNTRIYIKTADDYAISFISLDSIQQILTGDSTDYMIEISDKSNHTVEVKTSLNTVQWLNPFNDISENAWYFAPVGYCYTKGYFKGKSELLFAPNDYTVRKNIAVVLGKVYESISGNKIENTSGCNFADVEKGSYYEKYIQWASDNGIAGGVGNGVFGINSYVTRAQIVLMLKNLESLLKRDTSYDETAVKNVTDISDAGEWANEALGWAVTKGIMSASTNTVNPKGYATRAQIAQMLYNLYR